MRRSPASGLARSRLAGAGRRARRLHHPRRAACRPPPYDSLNLGDHVGDDAGGGGRQPGAAGAGHGRAPGVPEAGAWHAAWCRWMRRHARRHRGRCLPHARSAAWPAPSWWPTACRCCCADAQGTRVAAAHAGWRGLAGQRGVGVLEATCEHFGAPARRTGASSYRIP